MCSSLTKRVILSAGAMLIFSAAEVVSVNPGLRESVPESRTIVSIDQMPEGERPITYLGP